MSVSSVLALTWLGRGTAAVALTAVAVWLLLRLTGLQSPAVHRFAWLAVLLQGIVLWRVPVELPVLPAKLPVLPVELSVLPVTNPATVAAARPVGVGSAQPPSDDVPIHSENAATPPFITPTENAGTPSFITPTASAGTVPFIAPRERPSLALPWSSVVLGAWLCGIVVVVARGGAAYFSFCRALPPPDPTRIEWQEELTELCQELAIPRGRVLLQVTEQLGPALCLLPSGYRLLVPGSAWQRLSAVQRRAILRHELAHCLRGDLWKSLLMRVLALPQWFNPLVWHAVRRFDDAAEWACDDAVQSGEQDQVFEYLRALVFLGGSQRAGTSLQAAVRGGSLQFRVRRLSFPSSEEPKMKKLAIVTVILLVAAAGLTQVRLAIAQSPATSSEGQSRRARIESANEEPTNAPGPSLRRRTITEEYDQAEPAKTPGGSLLSNGGFEEPQDYSNDPQGWFGTRVPQTAGHFLLAVSPRVAHGGKRSVFVEIGDSHPDHKVAYNWTAVAKGWQAGKTYELSGWVKVENAKNTAWIMCQFWSEEGKDGKMIGGATTQMKNPVKGTTDWTRVSTRLTVPEGTKVLRIRAGLASEGNPGAKAWFDDLSLVPVAN